MTSPSSSPNPFQDLIAKLRHRLAHFRNFIGVYVNNQGKMRILRDSATGKIAWYSSCALLHTEFLKKWHSNDPDYAQCDFYAITGEHYITNHLLIHGYEKTSVKVSYEMLCAFSALALNFHNKTNIAMFMPLSYNLNKMYDKIKSDPSLMFTALIKAKQLLFKESKPCSSCQELCHVPNILEQTDDFLEKEIKELDIIKQNDMYFCFSCGKILLINAAKHRMLKCTDFNKIQRVQSLVVELERFDMSNNNFDFERAAATMHELMAIIGNSNMTVIDNNKIVRKDKFESVDSVFNKDELPDVNTPPWMN